MRLAIGICGSLLALVAALPAARAETCVLIDAAPADAECRVDDSGAVAGGPRLHYRLQSYYQSGAWVGSGVAVIADEPAPIAATYGDTAHYDKPELVDGVAGQLLLLSGHLEGSGNFDASALYAFENDKARAIDTDAWQHDLVKRLPKGLGARKGIYPDYRTMKAETPLWRAADAECCPTGGHASIALVLEGDKLAIGKLTVRQGPPPKTKSAATTGGDTLKICGKPIEFKFDAASFADPAADDIAARATAEGHGPALVQDAFDALCAQHALAPDEVARRVGVVAIGWAGGADNFTAYFPEAEKGWLRTQWSWQGTDVPDADDVRAGILCAFRPTRKECADRGP